MRHNLITLNDNILAAVDTETSGQEFGYHEVVQLAIVLLDQNLDPYDQFYTNVRPEYPQRIHPEAVRTHGLTAQVLESAPNKFTVADSLFEWFEGLGLAPGKRLIPLIHNSQFDVPFLQKMLGFEMFYQIFGYPTRDTQALAAAMMDRAAFNGTKLPFDGCSNGKLCTGLGTQLDDAHDALADALATARNYKALMNRSSW